MSHSASKNIWCDNCGDHFTSSYSNLKAARKEVKKHGWTSLRGKYSLHYKKTLDFDLCPKCKDVTRDDLYTIPFTCS